jgi:uncharacterized membrane protein YhaH (DUF805 family)
VTLATRLNKIDSPLWLDEIFGYRLARLGFPAIVQNSWNDPHPPLYYVTQWLVTGFGYIKSEIAWRCTSLLSGIVTIFVLRRTTNEIAGFYTSIAVSLFAATSPSLVFYSQEARPFSLLVLIAAVSMQLTIGLLSNPSENKLWIGWTITSLAGVYTGYAYAMLIVVQIMLLGVFGYRRSSYWVSCTIVLGGLSVLVPFAASSLSRVAGQHINSEPLSLWRTLQTLLAGEPLRYGISVAHTIVPLLTLGLLTAAAIRAFRLRDRKLIYLIVQVALPLIAFFAFSLWFSINLPLPEAKQFLALLPAFFLLLACGIQELIQRLGPRNGLAIGMAMFTIATSLNVIGLSSYWTHPKSPEGLLVIELQDRLQNGESIVSLHYSLNYALGFYSQQALIYFDPNQLSDAFNYRVSDSQHILDLPLPQQKWATTEDIRSQGRFWILANSAVYREPITSLVSGCRMTDHVIVSAINGSFEMMKVDCLPHP